MRSALLAVVLAATLAGTAQADFGTAPGTFAALMRDDVGADLSQAGAHPNATTEFDFTTTLDGQGNVVPDEDVRDIKVELPAGVIGNPTAVAQCSAQDFAAVACPAAAQVGIVTLTAGLFAGSGAPIDVSYAVYNLVPIDGRPAQFGFRLLRNNVVINVDIRSGSDYGVTALIKDIPGGILLFGSSLTLWGVPGSPVHDAERTPAGPVGSGSVPKAFFTNPTACGPALTTKIAVRSWQRPDRWVTDEVPAANGVFGCDRLPFAPTVAVRPQTSRVAAPAGYEVELAFGQNEDPAGLSPSALKDAVVTLPAGVVVSPSSADGLQGCSPAQVKLSSNAPAECPDRSKIGSVSIETPLLTAPLTGSVYLTSPTPQQLLGLYVVASGSGVTIKLAGTVDPDSVTGQLKTTFVNNPQLPVSRFRLSFKDGPRAPLANPHSCGPATTTTVLTPYSGQRAAIPSTSFDVSGDGHGAPCLAPTFEPSFTAGTIDPRGGADSPLNVSFGRNDTDELLSGVSLDLPKGLLARIASADLCDDAQAAAGTCGDGSRVGSVTTETGPGSLPLALPGRVYVTQSYKGAPFGLSIVVPAVAGPFDLGTVVVRAAILVDPITAAVRIVADPLPTILDGIPLQIRAVHVKIDRPGFTFNPTSCAPKAIDGVLGSVAGGAAARSVRFQVGDCAALGLKPSLALSLSGKGQTTDGKHPAVAAVLTQPASQANLKKVRVALPLSLALDPDNANGLCEFVDGSKAEPSCPKASIVGSATATTPVLNQPLSGPVYFVKNVRKDPKSGREIRTLPKLVVPLVGQNGVKLKLTGTSAVEDDQLVTTFDNIPDAPVSSFKLNITGGKGGILVVSDADICKATQIAEQQIDGQNGKAADTDVYIATPSCPLKVLSKTVGKTSVAVKVGGLGAGKVTVSGKGIKKTTKTITKSTVATVMVKRTKGAPSHIKASFLPKGTTMAKSATEKLMPRR
jgi:hypothetical protein